jgi:hypothetical protein
MTPVLARYYEFDPAVRTAAMVVVAATVALVLGVGLWLNFRNGRK